MKPVVAVVGNQTYMALLSINLYTSNYQYVSLININIIYQYLYYIELGLGLGLMPSYDRRGVWGAEAPPG